jgi:hypothetical protein
MPAFMVVGGLSWRAVMALCRAMMAVKLVVRVIDA